MKKKDTKTTVLGLIAAAMFLTSHPESPIKDVIPEKGKTYTVVLATVGLGLLGKFSADAGSGPPPPTPEKD